MAGVYIPEALERKYPGAGTSWEWFWLFPSRQALRDPRSGLQRPHHVLDASFQLATEPAGRLRTKLSGSANSKPLKPLQKLDEISRCWIRPSLHLGA